ncbi:hypothetical protein BOQ54_15530 [Chelatococcus daeguensis]|uniref:Uncharacterized protein n=1 Tax=Chelatococcus daeguensis TaxID=444444 RepID=A0AAC9JQW9_9HYPH|nr:hypothetical protein BOQ54_15530 [Chelatococcus daeguensis]
MPLLPLTELLSPAPLTGGGSGGMAGRSIDCIRRNVIHCANRLGLRLIMNFSRLPCEETGEEHRQFLLTSPVQLFLAGRRAETVCCLR